MVWTATRICSSTGANFSGSALRAACALSISPFSSAMSSLTSAITWSTGATAESNTSRTAASSFSSLAISPSMAARTVSTIFPTASILAMISSKAASTFLRGPVTDAAISWVLVSRAPIWTRSGASSLPTIWRERVSRSSTVSVAPFISSRRVATWPSTWVTNAVTDAPVASSSPTTVPASLAMRLRRSAISPRAVATASFDAIRVGSA